MRCLPSRRSIAVTAALFSVSACGTTTTRPAAAPPVTTASSSTTTSPPPPAMATAPVDAPAADWLTFHGDDRRTGDVATAANPAPLAVTWRSDLGAAVYGQPLDFDGMVLVATEDDKVVALNAGTGAVVWTTTIGKPLTDVRRVVGCGDIDPLGITSTPVIDSATSTIYVVGEVDAGGVVHHQMVGLDVRTGAVKVTDDVDPPLPAGEQAVTLLQRVGLALANGRVYVGYGGNDGDCGTYHGWVVSVAESGPAAEQSFEVASTGQGGAVWQSGGAPAIDASGDVYVSTGNANPDPPQGGPDPLPYTESVVKLSPSLKVLASYKDEVAGGDEDLSTGNPVLLPGGLVFAVGKTQIAYVLHQADLTQVAAVHGVCGSNPDGGPAFDAATDEVFVPCIGGGVQVVTMRTDTLGPRLSGANGSPIVLGSTVWSLQYPQGTLVGWNAATGAQVASLGLGVTVPKFVSPSYTAGQLFVPTTTGVVALR